MATARKTTAKKTVAKKAVAKKAVPRKAPAKRASARTVTGRGGARKAPSHTITIATLRTVEPIRPPDGEYRVRAAEFRDWQPAERTRFVTGVVGGIRPAAALLDVDPAQTSRWASGKSRPSPEQARLLLDMDHVMGHALLVWATDELVRDWLTTPNAHLDGATPVEWIRHHGSAEVVDALRAEAAGAFA
jgi:hypothetical protein